MHIIWELFGPLFYSYVGIIALGFALVLLWLATELVPIGLCLWLERKEK